MNTFFEEAPNFTTILLLINIYFVLVAHMPSLKYEAVCRVLMNGEQIILKFEIYYRHSEYLPF